MEHGTARLTTGADNRAKDVWLGRHVDFLVVQFTEALTECILGRWWTSALREVDWLSQCPDSAHQRHSRAWSS